jgi:hypothetical protein
MPYEENCEGNMHDNSSESRPLSDIIQNHKKEKRTVGKLISFKSYWLDVQFPVDLQAEWPNQGSYGEPLIWRNELAQKTNQPLVEQSTYSRMTH